MNVDPDKFTKFFGRLIDFAITRHADRTAAGVILGLALHSIAQIFATTIKSVTSFDPVTAVWYIWLGLGMAIVFFPNILFFMTHRSMGTENITELFRMLQASSMAKEEKDALWDRFFAVLLNSLNNETRSRLDELVQQTAESNRKDGATADIPGGSMAGAPTERESG